MSKTTMQPKWGCDYEKYARYRGAGTSHGKIQELWFEILKDVLQSYLLAYNSSEAASLASKEVRIP